MGQMVIQLGNDVDLIIDEPAPISSAERSLVIASALAHEVSGSTFLSPTTRSGSLPITIGYKAYHVYYQFKVKRVINALTAYSEAIRYIENNPHLYDQRLARTAINQLRECHRDELR